MKKVKHQNKIKEQMKIKEKLVFWFMIFNKAVIKVQSPLSVMASRQCGRVSPGQRSFGRPASA